MRPYFLIFGFGYTAKKLAPELIAKGFKVIGTHRKPNQEERNNLTTKLVVFDSEEIKHYLSLATHLLITIPPSRTDDDIVFSQYGDLIKKQAPHLKWVGYLSSTGVYGNHDGGWVSEKSPCNPHTSTAIARLKAEQDWLYFARVNRLPLHIFRLSGIYGPGRNALDRLMNCKKQSIFKKNQVFSRIHIDDIVATLMASIQQPNFLAIYNVSDDKPAPSYRVDSYAASLLHKAPLLLRFYSEALLSPMEQEFYASNRRVSNFKIKEELNVTLKYPSYKEGLTQIWRTYIEAK